MTKPQDPIEPLTATYPPHVQAKGSACQNCQTMLQGGYCHVCGQHAHNPLRSFRHAVEDVFESFWHVDGRIFRTLRDLMVPGKVSREYLNGHRVRYIPPLRIYVILSLITFFVAHFVTAGLKGGLDLALDDSNDFAAHTRVEEVIRARDQKLATLDKSLADARGTGQGATVAVAAIGTAREAVEKQAQVRIDQINGRPVTDDAMTVTVGGGLLQSKADPASSTSPPSDGKAETTEDKLSRTAEENARLFAKDKRALAERILTHTPSILLVLVPLFALVLRVIYPLRPMGYLEHLVVALYSHAFLLLVALTWMLMLLLDRAMGSNLLGAIAITIFPILIPIYLLFSQKRIYGDGWAMTLFRFAITSMVYFALATLAIAAAFALALLLKG